MSALAKVVAAPVTLRCDLCNGAADGWDGMGQESVCAVLSLLSWWGGDQRRIDPRPFFLHPHHTIVVACSLPPSLDDASSERLRRF